MGTTIILRRWYLTMHLRSESTNGMQRMPLYDRDKARENKKAKTLDLMSLIPACAWSLDVNNHWSHIRDAFQNLASKHFPKAKRKKRQLYFSEKRWDLVCHRKDLRQMHREQQQEARADMLQWVFYMWKQKRQAREHEKYQKHLHHMKMALTMHRRQITDRALRKQKAIEWKQWMVKHMDQKIDELNKAQATELFKILQPKKILAKSHGKSHKSLPGMRDADGHWQLGQENIAAAWEKQFSAIENAEQSDMKQLVESSKPNCKPRSLDDLCSLPAIFEVEDALRQMNDSKAAGLDNIGAELLQIDIPATARRLYPTLVKSAWRSQSIPDFLGGWLIPLFKGKGPMAGHRAILLEAVVARIFSRSWKPRLEAALARTAAPMQWGGRKGLSTESLHLQTRMWGMTARAAKLAVCIIYVDIRSAFYSVSKQLLIGCQAPEHEIPTIARMLEIPETALEAFAENMRTTQAVHHATESRLTTEVVTNMLSDTWFAIPSGQHICKPATGSRPGDPVADILFGLIMGHLLQSIHERLQQAGVWRYTPTTAEPMPLNLTWVDDTNFAIFAPPDKLVDVALQTLAIIVDTALEFGLKLSLGETKTTAVCTFHGKGAVAARQGMEATFPESFPVLTEHLGVVQIPNTNHYKYLGGIVARNGSLMPELHVRSALTMARLQPLKKVMRDPRIDLKSRQTLLKTMCLSVATVHAGTWSNLTLSSKDGKESFTMPMPHCNPDRSKRSTHMSMHTV